MKDIYKRYGIYGIKNKINNKIYIGKTMQSFGDRWDCHKAQLNGGYHDNPYLQNSWNKYGADNFEFIIIYDCINNESEDFVNQLEIDEIAKYKNLNLAYNIHEGGTGGMWLGKHLSEETKRKIGEKNRINMLGKKLPDSVKQKMSNSQKERYDSWSEQDRIEWGNKLSKCLTGIKKPSLSIAMKNNKHGAKYSIDQVKQIRKLHEQDGLGYTEISNILNIPRPAVYLIATYRRWKDI